MELANAYNKGQNMYPKSLNEAYEMMIHDARSQGTGALPDGNPGMAFGTIQVTPGTNTQPNPKPHVVSFRCGRRGHYEDGCREFTR